MHPRAVVLVTSLAVVPLSWPAAASPQLRSTPTVPERAAPTPGPAPAQVSAGAGSGWDTFSADVTIRRHVVKADGTATREAPAMRYRWQRTFGSRGWTTTMSVLSVAPETVHGLSGPRRLPGGSPVSRIEIGDARTPMRVFDANDQLMFQLPTQPRAAGDTSHVPAGLAETSPVPAGPADLPERAQADAMSHDWLQQYLPGAADIAARRTRLARELGLRSGNARGLERFVTDADGTTTEVLLDPAWAVPVETNVVRGGTLVSHTVVSYQQAPGGGLVRRRVRSEQLISAESGDRAVAEIDFENVRLGRGGLR